MPKTVPGCEPLKSLEAAIRRAAAADCLAETLALTGEYVTKVEQRIRSLPGGSEELPTLRNRTILLFEFAIAMASASRQYAAAELEQVKLLAHYRYSTGSSQRFGTRA
ncbi:MAG: hypothetical protein WBL65_12450 [Bryobacteraceae bacterium]